MNDKDQSPGILNIRVLIVLAVIAAGMLAILLQDVVQSLILTPIQYISWWIQIIYETLPQIFWWGVLIVFLLIIAVRSLTSVRLSRSRTIEKDRLGKSCLEVWTENIEKAEKGGYFKWYLAHKISMLTLDILADQERMTKDEAAAYLQGGKFNLPIDVRDYIKTGLDARISFQISELEKRFFILERKSPIKLTPEEMVEYIEQKLD